MTDQIVTCEHCGIPIHECSALALARLEAIKFLRMEGYSSIQARETVKRLIPEIKRGEHRGKDGHE